MLVEAKMQDMNTGKVRAVAQVPLIDGLQTPYYHFRDNFMRPNLPVLISGLMDNWRAFTDWSSPSGDPDLDHIASRFGESEVQVAECSTRDFTDQKRVDMTVADYISYWKLHNSNIQKSDRVDSLLYLKDWHFVKDYPEYGPYTTPTLFMDDWLNFYLDYYQLHATDTQAMTTECLSDYRFVYMGPKGTWTPLHADVLRSYSWSGNVCGKKLWHLLPPSETHLIYDRHMRTTVYDIYGDVSVKEFPNFYQAGWLECTQERGQILFVPSGWYHQVTNLEDAVSINHNWFNGYNLHWVWDLLLADYEETRASIEDIRLIADNFEELCQRNLAANSGMNFQDFFLFLRRMTIFSLLFLRHKNSRDKVDDRSQEGNWLIPSNLKFVCRDVLFQVLFNLQSIGCVTQLVASADMFQRYPSTLPKGGQKVKSQDQNIAGSGNGEVCTSNGWVDGLQCSEYSIFLTQLINECKVHTSDDTSGGCLCANSVNIEDLQCSLETTSKQTSSMRVLHYGTPEVNCLEDIAVDECEAVISSLENFEIMVNTPRLLVKVIKAVIYHLIQA